MVSDRRGTTLFPLGSSMVFLQPSWQANLLQELDDPDITMEEYIQLEAEKAHGRGQEFNWCWELWTSTT
ncbi:hypothetical protein Tco_0674712 [Tanacetum coccineum]